MFSLKTTKLICSRKELSDIPKGKVLINTINAFSYNNAQKDELFAESLRNGNYLIPDGASIVKACRWIKAESQPKERIAGWDLFEYEMQRLNCISNDCISDDFPITEGKPTVMFVGSSENVLNLIRERAAKDYPNLRIVTYSPPYKTVFSEEENSAIISAINSANPDLLWIGMTAPKQEKWAYQHWSELEINCHVGTIGAVFDFFAGTTKRAPIWWQRHSLEWLYRLIKEPRRMWRRYIIGNIRFIFLVLKE